MGVANLAAQIRVPISGEVYHRAGTGASARYEIPDSWRGKYVKLVAEGQPLRILFGGSSVEITDEQTSTISGEELTPHAETGDYVPADLPSDVGVIPASAATGSPTHFAIYQATGGRWTMRRNDPSNTGQG